MLFPNPQVLCVKAVAKPITEGMDIQPTPGVVIMPTRSIPKTPKMNEGATIMSIEERSENANKRIENAEPQQRMKRNYEREAQRKKDYRRKYIIGELVTKYFPTVQEYEPGETVNENGIRFEPLEAFLYILSTDLELVEELQRRANQLMSEGPDGEWRVTT